MMNYLQEAISLHRLDHKPYCLILCDIDDFKRINDTFGHECGDVVLTTISHILKERLPQCQISRWGGEEILILAPFHVVVCRTMIDSLRRYLENYNFEYNKKRVHVTMTFGMIEFNEENDINELVQNIDYAPTFLELAGVEVPSDIHGQSMVPLLKGEKPKDWRKGLYY